MGKFVAYARVSTQKQGHSGLGLAAQRDAVERYAAQQGGHVAAVFVETESGKNNARPELAKAIAQAKRGRAVLLVAKLDRLSRNSVFLGTLLESGLDVAFCDLPSVPPGATGRFIIQQMANIAELEAGLIAERTRAALQAAKARGQQLGSARPGHWEGREEARLRGAMKGGTAAAAVHRQRAADAYTDLIPTVADLRREGMSLQAIAERLNADGHTTRRGKPWNPVQVGRVLERLEVACAPSQGRRGNE
jgi:DNA invertase Pin-like site-specific DNA recombinase